MSHYANVNVKVSKNCQQIANHENIETACVVCTIFNTPKTVVFWVKRYNNGVFSCRLRCMYLHALIYIRTFSRSQQYFDENATPTMAAITFHGTGRTPRCDATSSLVSCIFWREPEAVSPAVNQIITRPFYTSL